MELQTTEIQANDDLNENERFKVSLVDFEGPVDLLLSLARDQKFDLNKISILQLAEQYLAYIEQAHQLRLEIAADYLVMAAWLAYLKSRLLLPKEEQPSDEPTAEHMADALAFQLRRLQAMQDVAQTLMQRPQLGINVFRRGAPEGFIKIEKPLWQDSLYDVLAAYGDIRRRSVKAVYHPPQPFQLFTMDEAIERIGTLFGQRNLWRSGEWTSLEDFLPENLRGLAATAPLMSRSTLSALFSATLEMAKLGSIDVRQDENFGAIYLRARQRNAGSASE